MHVQSSFVTFYLFNLQDYFWLLYKGSQFFCLAILFEHGKSYTGLVAEQYSCKYLLLQLLFYERSFLQLYEISAAVRVYFNTPVSIMAFGQIASDAMSKLLLAGPETELML